MPRERGVNLSGSSAARLAESNRYVEQQPRSKARPIDGPDHFAGLVVLFTTTSVGRATGTNGNTPGTGSGKVQKLVGGSYADSTTDAVPILNDTDSLIAPNAYVGCLPGPGGKFHFVITSCKNIS